ncbi:LemA family protein [Xylophilus ampelinus]|uniref:LemA protein n=1 Tax=Xylophilus ampelinus TaxID=54067 RepID=A0A318SLS1_9BURK|nr:LemA family protein [Xylophilus ampelinus]MCS4510280.1 LemA family protein [Xylophilus ampelinus]PYE78099.1 LemA protein [Xylophilus ampelinus]
MFQSLWWWSVLAVGLFWSVGAHNRLVRLRGAVLQAFGALDTRMQAWVAMAQTPTAPVPAAAPADRAGRMPSGPEAAADAPPADAAPAPSLATQTLWSGTHAAALQLGNSLAASRAKPLDREAMAALTAAREVLLSAWRRLLREAPDFSATLHVGGIHVQWDQQETQVQLACDAFNLAVQRYNAALGKFPAALLAWLFRFQPARPI